jgi:hypothetical protein
MENCNYSHAVATLTSHTKLLTALSSSLEDDIDFYFLEPTSFPHKSILSIEFFFLFLGRDIDTESLIIATIAINGESILQAPAVNHSPVVSLLESERIQSQT